MLNVAFNDTCYGKFMMRATHSQELYKLLRESKNNERIPAMWVSTLHRTQLEFF
jgi:hypothetical protein